MDNLIIESGEGIGLIKFGMSKDEVEKCIQSYTEKYQKEYHIQDYFKGSSCWNMILKVRLIL
ncbi:hypothetical protein BAG01nite_12000 [Brevibacillus agri]|uniref:Uncharacterized protein n=1 Tax=Brevibacillus agri TaxID=51101 RepID=A0ABQ0SML2_9BACL|nr:hypothetical protein BAG01nite_12000 [Brevibacillus agri]